MCAAVRVAELHVNGVVEQSHAATGLQDSVGLLEKAWSVEPVEGRHGCHQVHWAVSKRQLLGHTLSKDGTVATAKSNFWPLLRTRGARIRDLRVKHEHATCMMLTQNTTADGIMFKRFSGTTHFLNLLCKFQSSPECTETQVSHSTAWCNQCPMQCVWADHQTNQMFFTVTAVAEINLGRYGTPTCSILNKKTHYEINNHMNKLCKIYK